MTRFEKWMCWWMDLIGVVYWLSAALIAIGLILQCFIKGLTLPALIAFAPILLWLVVFFINLIIYGIKYKIELNRKKKYDKG